MRDPWNFPPAKIPRFKRAAGGFRLVRGAGGGAARPDRAQAGTGAQLQGIDPHPPEARPTMADPINLSDPERARLEQRRDRLMKLLKDGDGEPLDADDRADLTQEWHKIDQLLQRR
jgi:hypothetical protein